MDISAYIASGILENYVMGLASDQERQEVQCLSKIYPEIARELQVLEITLERYALENEVKPPVQLKTKLFDQLDAILTDQPDSKQSNQPLKSMVTAAPNYWRYAAAALLTGVVFLTGYFISRQKKNEQQWMALNNQHQFLQQQLDSSRNILQDLSFEIILTRNPLIRQVHLKGVPTKDTLANLTVYWNPQNQQVYLAGIALPPLPPNKQYQLWGLKNGQPIDLGVFDPVHGILPMKHIDAVQAFAVTLENAGGSAVPTLSEMVVLGQI